MDNIKKTELFITAVLGSMWGFLGNLAVPLCLMLCANVLDYVTGWAAAPWRGQERTSYRSMQGITKKIMMWVLVLVGVGLDIMVNYAAGLLSISEVPTIFGALAAVWICCNEGISILENIRDTGTETPKFLQMLIEKLKLTAEKTGEEVKKHDA